ncbi:MAG TPA: glycerophosphodiester phosphodiesterase family protein, partial [Pyrinomonadaceae bacterium]|nr:glycerophosphodiester phosphodiesterase family protein [Pyrinomonadaceae bacterium]
MSTPLIIGHRGASAVAPENTIAAFKEAIAVGADGVEFDVRLTRDRVPVVIHDSTLRRTAGLQRRVADLTWAELEQVDVGSWFDRKFA